MAGPFDFFLETFLKFVLVIKCVSELCNSKKKKNPAIYVFQVCKLSFLESEFHELMIRACYFLGWRFGSDGFVNKSSLRYVGLLGNSTLLMVFDDVPTFSSYINTMLCCKTHRWLLVVWEWICRFSVFWVGSLIFFLLKINFLINRIAVLANY